MNPLTLEWVEKAEGDMNLLEGYAVLVRYPGQFATKDDAKIAVKAAQTTRSFIRSKLNIQ